MNELIQIKNVSKRFSNQILFENVNFKIYERGFYGLKGVSGSGKSTLLLMLGLLEEDYEGDIYFKDKNLKAIKNKEKFIFENIGFVFQSPILFPDLTLEENLKLINNVDQKRINNLLHRLDLFSKKNFLAKKLSGGERLRLTLVRALINNPKILLLDEPTSSLDEYNSKIVMDFLKEESKNRAIFIVSHNEELLNEYVDYLYVLKKQKIKLEKQNELLVSYDINNRKAKRNKLSFTFLIKYLLANLTKKKLKSFLLIFSLFLSFFVVGFSLMLSHDVSYEITNSLNALMNDNQVILKSKIENSMEEIKSVEESEALEIINSSKYFYDYGYIYIADFEKQFVDENYFSLVSEKNLTFYEVGLRAVSETINLNDIPLSTKFYPNSVSNLKNDEIVLGLRKNDIRKICSSLGLEDLDENSLSNYLKYNNIDFCFYFSNDSWEYHNEVLLRLKAFFVVDQQIVLAHDNKFFTTDFFENKMKLPYSTNLSESDYYPWAIKKQIFLKSEIVDIESAIHEYFTSEYYELYDLEILKGNLTSEAFSSIYHKGKFLLTYAQNEKVSYESVKKYEKYMESLYPAGQFYELIDSALVSGFTNSIFFASNEDDLLEVEYYFNEIDENVDTLNLSSFEFGNISYGNLITSAFQKGVKLDSEYGKIIFGRVPEGVDEVMISSSLCKILYGTYEEGLNQKLYVIFNNYDLTFGNVFLHAFLNVSGIYESDNERIYQSEYWYPEFLVNRLDYSLKDIQINKFLCTVKNDVEDFSHLDTRFEVINPLLTITESVDSMLDMIEKVLFIFTILLIISSFGVALITIESSMKEAAKEIGLLKAIGISKKSIFTLYFIYNLSYFILAYILSSINLFLTSKFISIFYFNGTFNFNVYVKPYQVMFVEGLFLILPLALIYTIFPIIQNSAKLIKRYY